MIASSFTPTFTLSLQEEGNEFFSHLLTVYWYRMRRQNHTAEVNRTQVVTR